MSAETLRRAATLMRERAEAASPPAHPRWEAWQTVQAAEYHVGIAGRGFGGLVASPSRAPDDYGRGCAKHIASWHPAVALAVADWLDGISIEIDGAFDRERYADVNPNARHALTIARTYLGETP